MKGVIFTELMDMVEDKFPMEVVDQVIEESDLPSGGVYTSLGTYDYTEVLELVTHLSSASGIPIADLVYTFGHHLFGRFAHLYPQFFEDTTGVFEFLQHIEQYIHVEVRKLYSDAQLPTFEYDTSDPNQLVMTYRSERPFAVLAKGLIDGCIEYFNENLIVEMVDLADGAGTSARFTLTKVTG